MINTRLLLSLLCLFLISSSVFAARPVYVQEKSGYNTSTQVVGSKEIFTRHQFREGDFDGWLTLVYQAQAFDLFEKLVADRRLTAKGIVIGQELVIGDNTAEPGTMVTPEWLCDAMPRTYTGRDILSQLIQQGVLDQTGFVAGVTGNKNIEFEPVDFSSILPKLMKISLPIQNTNLATAIMDDLYNLIVTYHREIEVTSQQSTTYQSRNDNILVGLFESIGGNFLAKTFSPDKINVSRTGLAYTPRIDVGSYSSLKIGFAPYFGFGNHPGQWAIGGKKDSLKLEATTLTSPKLQSTRVDVDYRFIDRLQSYRQSFGFNMAKAVYSQYKAKEDGSTFNNVYVFFPYLSGGSISNTTAANGMMMTYGMGLGYSRGTDRNNLGLAFNFGTDIPIFYWLNFDFGLLFAFQPGSGEHNVWDRSEIKLGLSALLAPQINAEVGYNLIGSTTDVKDNELFYGLKLYF